TPHTSHSPPSAAYCTSAFASDTQPAIRVVVAAAAVAKKRKARESARQTNKRGSSQLTTKGRHQKDRLRSRTTGFIFPERASSIHNNMSTRTEFNTGIWANEEHQNFIRGLEMHGRGNWNAIGTFVRSRSQLQIRAHAQQHFAEDESVGLEQPATFVQGNHAGGAALSSSSSSPLPWGGGSGGASVVRLGVFDGATGSRSRSHSSSSSSSSSPHREPHSRRPPGGAPRRQQRHPHRPLTDGRRSRRGVTTCGGH
ncbi:unnamed protein product, partial [Pylaiella littoralis]